MHIFMSSKKQEINSIKQLQINTFGYDTQTTT